MTPPSAVLSVTIADDASSWASAGFEIAGRAGTPCARIGTVDFRLIGKDKRSKDEYAVRSWLFHRAGDPAGETRHDVDGLDIRTTGTAPVPGNPGKHTNFVATIDHLVIQSPNVAKVVAEFESKLEMKPRRFGPVKGRKRLLFAFFKLDDGNIIEGDYQLRHSSVFCWLFLIRAPCPDQLSDPTERTQK